MLKGGCLAEICQGLEMFAGSKFRWRMYDSVKGAESGIKDQRKVGGQEEGVPCLLRSPSCVVTYSVKTVAKVFKRTSAELGVK